METVPDYLKCITLPINIIKSCCPSVFRAIKLHRDCHSIFSNSNRFCIFNKHSQSTVYNHRCNHFLYCFHGKRCSPLFAALCVALFALVIYKTYFYSKNNRQTQIVFLTPDLLIKRTDETKELFSFENSFKIIFLCRID